jgi:hypothetical protein
VHENLNKQVGRYHTDTTAIAVTDERGTTKIAQP